jgi:hypothetical protein
MQKCMIKIIEIMEKWEWRQNPHASTVIHLKTKEKNLTKIETYSMVMK